MSTFPIKAVAAFIALLPFTATLVARDAQPKTLREVCGEIYQLSGRDYLLCIEALDHFKDQGVFLRRPVQLDRALNKLSRRSELVQWLRSNNIKFHESGRVILLIDDELSTIRDNPLDAEFGNATIEASPNDVIIQATQLLGIGVGASARINRSPKRQLRFELKPRDKLRDLLIRLAEQAELEWRAEVTPVSRYPNEQPKTGVSVRPTNGFFTLEITG